MLDSILTGFFYRIIHTFKLNLFIHRVIFQGPFLAAQQFLILSSVCIFDARVNRQFKLFAR